MIDEREIIEGSIATPSARPEATMASPISMGAEVMKAKEVHKESVPAPEIKMDLRPEQEEEKEYLTIESPVLQEQKLEYPELVGKPIQAEWKASQFTKEVVKQSNLNSLYKSMAKAAKRATTMEEEGYADYYGSPEVKELIKKAAEKEAEKYEEKAKEAYYAMHHAKTERSKVIRTLDNKAMIVGHELAAGLTDWGLNYENFAATYLSNLVGGSVIGMTNIASTPIKELAKAVWTSQTSSAWAVHSEAENVELTEGRELFDEEKWDIYKDTTLNSLAFSAGSHALGQFMKMALQGKVNQAKAYPTQDPILLEYVEKVQNTGVDSTLPALGGKATPRTVVVSMDGNFYGGPKDIADVVENMQSGQVNAVDQLRFTEATTGTEISQINVAYDMDLDPYINNTAPVLVRAEHLIAPTVEPDPSITQAPTRPNREEFVREIDTYVPFDQIRNSSTKTFETVIGEGEATTSVKIVTKPDGKIEVTYSNATGDVKGDGIFDTIEDFNAWADTNLQGMEKSYKAKSVDVAGYNKAVEEYQAKKSTFKGKTEQDTTTPINKIDTPKAIIKNYPYRGGIVAVEIPKLELSPEEGRSTFLRFFRTDANSRVTQEIGGVVQVLTGEEKMKFGNFGVARQESTKQLIDMVQRAGRELENLDQTAEAIAMRTYGDTSKAKIDFNAEYMLNGYIVNWYDGKINVMHGNLAREKHAIIQDIFRKGGFSSIQNMVDSYEPTGVTKAYVLGVEATADPSLELTPEQQTALGEFNDVIQTIGKEHEAMTQRRHATYYQDAYEDISSLKGKLFEDVDGIPTMKQTPGTILENGPTYAKLHALINKHLADIAEYTKFKDVDLMDSADVWMTLGTMHDSDSLNGLGLEYMLEKGVLDVDTLKFLESYGMIKYNDGDIRVSGREFIENYKTMLEDYNSLDANGKLMFDKVQRALGDTTTLPPHLDYFEGAELATPLSILDWFETVQDNAILNKTTRTKLVKTAVEDIRTYIDNVNEFHERWTPDMKGLIAQGKDITELGKAYEKVEKFIELINSDKDITRSLKSKSIQDLANQLVAINEKYNLGLTADDIKSIDAALNTEGYADYLAKKAEIKQEIADVYNAARAEVNSYIESTKEDIRIVSDTTKEYIEAVNNKYNSQVAEIKSAKGVYKTPDTPSEMEVPTDGGFSKDNFKEFVKTRRTTFQINRGQAKGLDKKKVMTVIGGGDAPSKAKDEGYMYIVRYTDPVTGVETQEDIEGTTYTEAQANLEKFEADLRQKIKDVGLIDFYQLDFDLHGRPLLIVGNATGRHSYNVLMGDLQEELKRLGVPIVKGNKETVHLPGLPKHEDMPFEMLPQEPNYVEALQNDGIIYGGNKRAEQRYMTPDEYIERAANALGQTVEDITRSRAASKHGDVSVVSSYAEAMKKGDKFPIPWVKDAEYEVTRNLDMWDVIEGDAKLSDLGSNFDIDYPGDKETLVRGLEYFADHIDWDKHITHNYDNMEDLVVDAIEIMMKETNEIPSFLFTAIEDVKGGFDEAYAVEKGLLSGDSVRDLGPEILGSETVLDNFGEVFDSFARAEVKDVKVEAQQEGLHRAFAAKEAGLEYIPVMVERGINQDFEGFGLSKGDYEALTQPQTSKAKPDLETARAEHAKQVEIVEAENARMKAEYEAKKAEMEAAQSVDIEKAKAQYAEEVKAIEAENAAMKAEYEAQVANVPTTGKVPERHRGVITSEITQVQDKLKEDLLKDFINDGPVFKDKEFVQVEDGVLVDHNGEVYVEDYEGGVVLVKGTKAYKDECENLAILWKDQTGEELRWPDGRKVAKNQYAKWADEVLQPFDTVDRARFKAEYESGDEGLISILRNKVAQMAPDGNKAQYKKLKSKYESQLEALTKEWENSPADPIPAAKEKYKIAVAEIEKRNEAKQIQWEDANRSALDSNEELKWEYKEDRRYAGQDYTEDSRYIPIEKPTYEPFPKFNPEDWIEGAPTNSIPEPQYKEIPEFDANNYIAPKQTYEQYVAEVETRNALREAEYELEKLEAIAEGAGDYTIEDFLKEKGMTVERYEGMDFMDQAVLAIEFDEAIEARNAKTVESVNEFKPDSIMTEEEFNKPLPQLEEPKYLEVPEFDESQYAPTEAPKAWDSDKTILYKDPKKYDVDFTYHNPKDFTKANLIEALQEQLNLPKDMTDVKVAGAVDRTKMGTKIVAGEGNDAQIIRGERNKWATLDGGKADLEFTHDGKKFHVSAYMEDGKWKGDFYIVANPPRGKKGDAGNIKNLVAERRAKIAEVKEKSAGKKGAIVELGDALKELDKLLKTSSTKIKGDVAIVEEVAKRVEYIAGLQKEIYGADYKAIALEDFPQIFNGLFELEDFKNTKVRSLKAFANKFKEGFEAKKVDSLKFQQEFFMQNIEDLRGRWKELRKTVNSDVNALPKMIEDGELDEIVKDLKGILDNIGEKNVDTVMLDSLIKRYKKLVEVTDRGGDNPVLSSGAARKRKTVIDSNSRMQMAKLGSAINKEQFLKDRGWFTSVSGDKSVTYDISEIDDIRKMTPELTEKYVKPEYRPVIEALYNEVEAQGIKLNVIDENGEAIPMDVDKFAYWYFRFLDDLNKTKSVTDVFSPNHKLELGNLVPFFESKEDFLNFMLIDEPKIGRSHYIKDNAKFLEGYFKRELRNQAENMVFGTSGSSFIKGLTKSQMFKDAAKVPDGQQVTKSLQILQGLQKKINDRSSGAAKLTRATESNAATSARKTLSSLITAFLSRSGAKETIGNAYHPAFRTLDIIGAGQYLWNAPSSFVRGIANSIVDIVDIRKVADYFGLFGRAVDSERVVSAADKAFRPVELFPSKNSLIEAEMSLDQALLQLAYEGKGAFERATDAFEYWKMQGQIKSDWGRKSGSFIAADKALKVLAGTEKLPEEALYRFTMAGIPEADIPRFREMLADLGKAGVNPYDFNDVYGFLGEEGWDDALKLTTLTNNVVAENFRAGRQKDVAPKLPKTLLEESLMAFRGFGVQQSGEDVLKLKYKTSKNGVPIPRIDYSRDGFMEAAKQTATTATIGAAHFLGTGAGTLLNSWMLRIAISGVAGWSYIAEKYAEYQEAKEKSQDYGWYHMIPYIGSLLLESATLSTLGTYDAGGNIVVDTVSDVKNASMRGLGLLAKSGWVDQSTLEAITGMTQEEVLALDYTAEHAVRNTILRLTGTSVPLKGVLDWKFYAEADPADREKYKQSVYDNFRQKNKDKVELINHFESSMDTIFSVMDGLINGDPKITKEFSDTFEEELGKNLMDASQVTYDGLNIQAASALSSGDITPDEYVEIREEIAEKSNFEVIWSKSVPEEVLDLGNKIVDFIGPESHADKIDIKRQVIAQASEGKSPKEIKDNLTQGNAAAVDTMANGSKELKGTQKELYNFFVKEFDLPEARVLRAVSQGLNFEQMIEEFEEAVMAKELAEQTGAPKTIKEGTYYRFTKDNQKNVRANQLYALAKPIADRIGIDVAQLMAQWAIESGWGSTGTSALAEAKAANCVFGVKATGWTGKTVELMTSEVVSYKDFKNKWEAKGFKIVSQYGNGKVKIQGKDRFRAYDSVEEAIEDYAKLIKRKYPTVDALKGYATSENYVETVRSIMKQFNTGETYKADYSNEDWVKADNVSGVASLGDQNWREKTEAGERLESVDYDLKAKITGQPEEEMHWVGARLPEQPQAQPEKVVESKEEIIATATGEATTTQEMPINPNVPTQQPQEEVAQVEPTPQEAPAQVEIPEVETARTEEILKTSDATVKDEIESKLVSMLTNKEILPVNMDEVEKSSLKGISLADFVPEGLPQASPDLEGSAPRNVGPTLGLSPEELGLLTDAPVEPKKAEEINKFLAEGTLEQAVEKLKTIKAVAGAKVASVKSGLDFAKEMYSKIISNQEATPEAKETANEVSQEIAKTVIEKLEKGEITPKEVKEAETKGLKLGLDFVMDIRNKIVGADSESVGAALDDADMARSISEFVINNTSNKKIDLKEGFDFATKMYTQIMGNSTQEVEPTQAVDESLALAQQAMRMAGSVDIPNVLENLQKTLTTVISTSKAANVANLVTSMQKIEPEQIGLVTSLEAKKVDAFIKAVRGIKDPELKKYTGKNSSVEDMQNAIDDFLEPEELSPWREFVRSTQWDLSVKGGAFTDWAVNSDAFLTKHKPNSKARRVVAAKLVELIEKEKANPESNIKHILTPVMDPNRTPEERLLKAQSIDISASSSRKLVEQVAQGKISDEMLDVLDYITKNSKYKWTVPSSGMHREPKEQAQYFVGGTSRTILGGNHLSGNALDIVPRDAKGNPDFSISDKDPRIKERDNLIRKYAKENGKNIRIFHVYNDGWDTPHIELFNEKNDPTGEEFKSMLESLGIK